MSKLHVGPFHNFFLELSDNFFVSIAIRCHVVPANVLSLEGLDFGDKDVLKETVHLILKISLFFFVFPVRSDGRN